ncbi:MAG: MBL fold metallo-hydrolase [Armatimonadetes bacterium]|nr:MBL fold metallo-hydrolase [Armatimonadota bacterium]
MPTLHVLGAGTPSPTPERFGTSCLVEFQDDLVMVDCGPASTWKLACAGFRTTDLGWLLFTHHHSDHNADYPCLQLVRWDHSIGVEDPLHVYGPPPTEEITRRLLGPDGAFADDLTARVEHIASQRVHANRGGSLPRPAPVFDVHDTAPGESVHGNGWTATCARSEHMQPWMDSLAWRIDWDGGSVVFTGDTRPCASVVELARGAGTLVANCPLRQEQLQPELGSCIYGTLDAAEAARDAGVERLLLIHLTPTLSRERDIAAAEMAEIYDGEIVFGDEMMTLSL